MNDNSETPPTSTLPSHTATQATRARHVILRLNVVERHHQVFSESEARRLVDDPEPVCLALDEEFDRHAVTPRQWRVIARKLDQLVADARTAATGPVRYIVAGRAPLPVFAYLGASMIRMGSISVANDFRGISELFGPPEACPGNGRDSFTIEPPSVGRLHDGRFALSVQCSGEFRSPDVSVEAFLADEGATFLGTYAIHSTGFRSSDALTAAELPVLIDRFEQGLKWIGEKAPKADSLVVPIAGPNWVAFWLGRRLTPTVCGRFDFPNYVPGSGYEPALSYPMAKAPWLVGKAKLLLMNAEPANQTRTRGGKSFDVVQDALERELGPESDGPYAIKHRGAAKIRDFMREVETFRPDILHLHLHGARNGDLAFEDERGETAHFKADQFVAMLRATGVQPTLIVLSACYSAALAPKLETLAECVIAMKERVGVDDAIAFSQFFYEALGRGNHLARAIEQGKAGANIDILTVHTHGDLRTDEITLMPRLKKNH